ncbi:Endopolyphosphatase [Lachnellula occidentalis]|uniref:Endopolyphosphatase n=1 Tax=Lachnellula occidentalis TaxID=215460 RepID=A0A8H8S7W8_9HELO|nr:Endopolyphosphatase [Lachnellula occidentalis]
MRIFATCIPVAACTCLLHQGSCATPTPIGSTQNALRIPLEGLASSSSPSHHQHVPSSKRLHGRFLHITDLHPDPFYKVQSSTEEDDACHRGKGAAGVYGAESSDCDTPFGLVNATFEWIEKNIRDTVDFVIWTGDSARHDSDEQIPRNQDEVLSTNRWIAGKFAETFSKADDPKNALTIPIISTFGNNDILPHNILLAGPNKWLKTYTDIWDKFIPEEQRHGFERGGWYYVEVIPHKLAVFSLNTLYFFSHNAAVDGCAQRSEPGYEHFEWLRIQLQFMRERGMKAILTGHVPPARTDSKQLWDETCWQKYTLWLKQYRDVIVGGIYGHMNIDHFMLHDNREIDILESATSGEVRGLMDDEFSVQSANDYLEELREHWSDLPNPAAAIKESPVKKNKGKKGKKSKMDKLLKQIGGPWGERYSLTNVGPSVVPNYFPTLRVIEYNITGLDQVAKASTEKLDWPADDCDFMDDEDNYSDFNEAADDDLSIAKTQRTEGKKHKKKKHKKKPNPDLLVPSPPSKSSPPGPAYSPQTLTMLGYTQYFANLTFLNNVDFIDSDVSEDNIDAEKWRGGKHKGKHPKHKIPDPKPFQYQVEYDTFTDPIYKLKDMTVRSYIKLAHRIGQYKPEKGDEIDEMLKDLEDDVFEEDDDNNFDSYDHEVNAEKHKDKKHHRQHEKNKVWLRFIKRAFVGTLEDEELHNFEKPLELNPLEQYSGTIDIHDDEL